MQSNMLWTRLCIAIILAAVQMIIALRVVPGATVEAHSFMMAFVIGGPWLVALLVVHPARLSGALKAAFLGRTGEELATARVLELLGGLTVAFGAIGALGTLHAFYQAMPYVSGFDREAVPGVVAAAIMPPAFALIVRVTIFEPVVLSLRRRSMAKDTAKVAPSRMGAAWKIALIVVVTVLAVEGFRAIVLGYLAPRLRPTYDTSVVVVGTDSTSSRLARDTEGPIFIEISRSDVVTECRVDGKSVGARPGRRDEVEDDVAEMTAKNSRRAVEIDVAPTVPVKDLVAIIDACVRVRIAQSEDSEASTSPGFRIRLLAKKPLAVRQRIRLVRRDWDFRRWRNLLRLQLPASETSEPVCLDEDNPPTINIMYDDDARSSEIWINRYLITFAELKTWIRPIAQSRIDSKTGVSAVSVLIRCDKDASSQSLLRILAILADEDVRVSNVLLEVVPRN